MTAEKMELCSMRKYENFCKALRNLEDVRRYAPPYDNVVLIGLVTLYQICFEQAWKAMKEAMDQAGVNMAATGSPRSIIKEAYRLRMIDEEDAWLDALQARNLAAHAYQEQTAMEVVEQTRTVYLALFHRLKDSIEANWMA